MRKHSSQNHGGMPRGRGPGGMMQIVEKPKNFKKSGKKLLAYLKPFTLPLIIVVAFSALSCIFSIIGPKLLAKVTNELADGLMSSLRGGDAVIDFGVIGGIMVQLIILYSCSSLFLYIQGYIMSGISTKVSYRLRNAIMTKINNLPLSYFNHTSHGDVLSRITNDIDTLNQSLHQTISQMITSSTTIVGVLIMMLSISWQLTIVALCMVPVSFALIVLVIKRSQKYFAGQQELLGKLGGHIEEMYSGHTVMKAFNGEADSIAKFDAQNDKLFVSGWKSQFYSGLMMPIMVFIGNLGYLVICVIGASMAAGGGISIGSIQAFIQYVRSFTQPITQFANISNQLQQMIASFERVFDFLEQQQEPADEVLYTLDGIKIHGDIVFDHIVFGYEGTDKIVIKDFSATVSAGQKIAIVGPTGAGKTTIVKLLMRFHELHEGAILIDGMDIKNFDRHDIRREFGMVLQDTWLYNGTIMDNIRYGKLDASDQEVINAAKAAQADHFIQTLPEGYKTVLNEEATNISQGQKQLLTIARAILSDTKIMILDEATSSVDTRTEVLIQKAMDSLMKGRTSFIIAHRLSTIKNADLILVMNEGNIVEQGTHEQLMADGGFYAELYNSQFEKVS